MTEWIFACLPGNIKIENSKPEDYQAFWAKDPNDDVEDILTMEEKKERFVDILYRKSIEDLPWFTPRHH